MSSSERISTLHVQEFMKFFTGSQHNFGEYVYDKDEAGTGQKVSGKAQTIKEKLITMGEYKAHLNGEKGLGIIPITETNKCLFSVIDVDVYDEDLSGYVDAIERGRFPLIPFKSKSGGLHIYLFLKEETLVPVVVKAMKAFSFLLSIDLLMKRRKRETVEIFPKQMKLKVGEYGNWINLPYYNADKSSQYAMKAGKPLKLEEALSYIKTKQASIEEIEDFLKEVQYWDAPPCLQMIYLLNPTDKNAGRNNYLFSFGVYLKKKDEDFLEQNLQEINASMKEPLPEKEVESTILQSLLKKDYSYKCKETPCVDFCHRKECSKREYGIGKNEGYFSSVECGQLVQYKSMSPYYEWQVKLQTQEEWKVLKFNTEDEIIKQDVFLRLCMRELYELPSKLKSFVWFDKVNSALKEIKIVEVNREEDSSPEVLLRSLIIEFLTQKIASTKEQILKKRVYFDVETKDYWFRTKDLSEYVYVTKQCRFGTPQGLHSILREYKIVHKRVWTEGSKQQIRVACFSQSELEKYEYEDLSKPDFEQYKKTEY